MKIILASSSPYRKQLLQKICKEIECNSPDIDETPQSLETPEALVQRLARAKATKVHAEYLDKYENFLIIGSDQTCEVDGKPLGKPHTPEKAFEQLKSTSGKAVTFSTSLCVMNQFGETFEKVASTKVQFRELDDEEIKRYIKIEQPLDCAGSFKCEGLGISLFESIESTDPNALIGLSLIDVVSAFHHFNINPILDLQ